MIVNNCYQYKTQVEFEDIDSYGIAHHSKLINYLERARVHFFNDQNLSVQDGELLLVLASMEIKFFKPVKILEEVTVHLSLDVLKSASLIWNYKITTSENTILEAKVKQASVDGNNLKPCRFKDTYREALEKLIKSDT